ncbi:MULTISPECIES: hypothetical protein [unclassified Mesorhizobium]|uniref:hypothetical protein n=1 Tax=unclassified Mesorhizobium TaxID=325217 RepID=UPI00112923E7|nr:MULTISPECIES: hypothetical protein [unclassified Mesorhizobium]TPJ46040.1 hypothetical protein FJ437_15265 [Mesorhizobium sp. B2-6-6]MCA0008535.1 hypothetical protein [Mesorhizobium sp. B264B1B]MCA0018867.1 hypothetical protein [Mesorhizobium sp. B264B1A]MCA0025754.1 hypothetical protein [Mesorhizobium sp. B263B1A]MCA0058551.1 hypothetical protein [Mesorhizobium sp. B261B1A]
MTANPRALNARDKEAMEQIIGYDSRNYLDWEIGSAYEAILLALWAHRISPTQLTASRVLCPLAATHLRPMI